MAHAAQLPAEPEVSEEDKRRLAEKAAEEAAKAAIEAAQREADIRRYDAMFGGEDLQRRRAARTLSEQSLFDAVDITRRANFNAMTPDERKAYLEKQEALTADERYAPEQQHETEVAQELLMVYLEKRPIPDKLAMTLIGLVKAHNAEPPPAADAASRSAAERQVIKDEAEAEKRARAR